MTIQPVRPVAGARYQRRAASYVCRQKLPIDPAGLEPKISDLIAALARIRHEHGNIAVKRSTVEELRLLMVWTETSDTGGREILVL